MSGPTHSHGSPVRVLVVEDETPIRRVVVGYLQGEGFEVSEADTGSTRSSWPARGART
jgi:DNA-binding response OmpR family regulator